MKTIARVVLEPGARVFGVLAVILVAVSAAACSGGSSSAQTTTGPSPTLVTETFSGTIAKGGSRVHSFTVNSSGYTLLAGFSSIGPTTVTSLGMGLGNWDSASSTCGLNVTQVDAARAGSTALNGTANSGSFCVRIYDGGNVPDNTSVDYTVQIQHY